MMNIEKAFYQTCISRYTSSGFTRHKHLFTRIRGDLIYSYRLKKLYGNRLYTVEFGIFPLCMPLPVFLDAGGYEIDSFEIQKYSGWVVDPKSSASIMECVGSMCVIMETYMFPLFERCVDCRTSMHELIAMEELFERNRIDFLNSVNEMDCAVPWAHRSLFDDRKYYMALKCGDYSYARKYLENQISYNLQWSAIGERSSSDKSLEIVVEGDTPELDCYLEHLKQIELGNVAFFDKLLHSNERAMMNYVAVRYGIRDGSPS